MNYFCYGILKDYRLSENFPECYVSIRRSGGFMRTANSWFPMSSSIGLIVTVLEDWKTLEDELWNYNFYLAQLEKINILSEKKVWKKTTVENLEKQECEFIRLGKRLQWKCFFTKAWLTALISPGSRLGASNIKNTGKEVLSAHSVIRLHNLCFQPNLEFIRRIYWSAFKFRLRCLHGLGHNRTQIASSPAHPRRCFTRGSEWNPSLEEQLWVGHK